MQVNAEQTNPCTIVLDITVDETQVSRAFDSSYREFSKYTSIPGFRPGKAPRVLVEKYADAARVKQHTLEKIVQDAYVKAIAEQQITPFRDGRVDSGDLIDKQAFTFKAYVPLEPQVKIGQYTGLTADKPIYNVSDEVVEERIEALRDERAKLERVTGRGIEIGDIAIAEVKVEIEGETEPAELKRQLVQTGQNIPGFDDAILGANPGETRTFELTFPADFQEAEKAGKKGTFTFVLASISAKKKPEVDEEFVKAITNQELSVEEFRDLLKISLEAEAKQASNEMGEQNLIEQILKNSEIFFPDVLVIDEVNDKLRHLYTDLRRNQMSYEMYLARIGATAEQHQQSLAQQANVQIMALLALREIAMKEGLQGTEEETDAEFLNLLKQGSIANEDFVEYVQDPRRRLQVANALVQHKLHDFLFANNTLVEVEAKETLEEAQAAIESGETQTAETAEAPSAEATETTETTPSAEKAE